VADTERLGKPGDRNPNENMEEGGSSQGTAPGTGSAGEGTAGTTGGDTAGGTGSAPHHGGNAAPAGTGPSE
jgi:hypothetical protein